MIDIVSHSDIEEVDIDFNFKEPRKEVALNIKRSNFDAPASPESSLRHTDTAIENTPEKKAIRLNMIK